MKKILGLIARFDTIFSRLILSFTVIVIVVALIVDAFLIIQFSQRYNEQVEKLEISRVRSMEEELHDIFVGANRIMIEIANLQNKDEDVQRVLEKKVENDYYKFSKVLGYLSAVENQNIDCVDSIEFYSMRNGIWISTVSGIEYVSDDSEKVLESYGILQKETTFQGFRRWLSARMLEKDGEEYEVYSFVAGYPLYTKDSSKFKGYIVINILKEDIDVLMQNNLSGKLDALAIMNPAGEILLEAGNGQELARYKESYPDVLLKLPTQEEKECVITSPSNTLLCQKIGEEEWVLVKLLSQKEFYNETKEIQLKCIYFSILIILAGILLSYLFARRIYHPFYLIMNKLAQAKLSKKARESEYYYLDRAIDELSMRAVAKEEVLNRNINSIKQDFAAQILFGKLEEEQDISHKLQLLGYAEGYSDNYVLLVKLHQKIYQGLEKENIDSVNRSIIKFFDDYRKDAMFCIPTDLFNGSIGVLVSVKENGKEQMKHLRKLFNDYMSINFMLTPIILQSDSFVGLEETHVQYKRMLKVAEYIYFMPHTYFFDLNEIDEMLLHQKDTVVPNFELFTEALIARDMEEVKRILKRFVETPEIFRNSVENLHSIVLKYIFLYNYYLRDIMKDSKNKDSAEIYKEMNHIYDVEDFYYWFVDLIKNTFDDLSAMEENPKKTVIGLIENIIMESIDEENLSLDYIAEKVYLNPKYISRIFKEETGIKITQYITDCKLEKAAKLLLESNISLEELIKQVGFSSVNYFIKKFKEKYYVTPTQYRRNSIG